MRRTSPSSFSFAQQAAPSSPPATPTATTTSSTFAFGSKSKMSQQRRRGIADFSDLPDFPPTLHTNGGGTITPLGSGTTFSYNRFEPLDISPRSSSPASSDSESGADDDDDDSTSSRLRSSSPPIALVSSSPPSPQPQRRTRVLIVTNPSFEVEEFRESDYEQFDSDCESVLRPHQYEDAESEKARSTRASSPSQRHELERERELELDERVVSGIRDLDCGTKEMEIAVEEHELWVKKQKQIRRIKRRSSGSVRKRNLTESIGSDTDDEDVQPLCEGANEAGSSARRLKRKVVGERTSLIFDDPPVGRIEEVEEPLSGEERERSAIGVVEEARTSDEEDHEGWERAMPFYGLEDMDVDSEAATDSDEDDE